MPDGSATNQTQPGFRLDHVIEPIRRNLEAQHRAREEGLAASRQVIRQASLTIRAVHRHEFERAAQMLEELRQQAEATAAAMKDHPAVYYAGFLHDALKEYAEAALTLALVSGEPLPTPDTLGVSAAAYLHGLAEAVGELRRFVLDSLRRDGDASPDALLDAMDEIYAQLVTIDYPEAITQGLRRSTDMVRGVTERTRGDLTMAALQRRLDVQLTALRDQLHAADTSIS
jgi:translin